MNKFKVGDKVIIRDFEYWGVKGVITDIVMVEDRFLRYEVSVPYLNFNGEIDTQYYTYPENELELRK